MYTPILCPQIWIRFQKNGKIANTMVTNFFIKVKIYAPAKVKKLLARKFHIITTPVAKTFENQKFNLIFSCKRYNINVLSPSPIRDTMKNLVYSTPTWLLVLPQVHMRLSI